MILNMHSQANVIPFLPVSDTDIGESSREYPRITAIQTHTKAQSKMQWILLSCILSSAMLLTSVLCAVAAFFSVVTILTTKFWLTISAGSFGVAGSNFIYLRRLCTK